MQCDHCHDDFTEQEARNRKFTTWNHGGRQYHSHYHCFESLFASVTRREQPEARNYEIGRIE